ncbi:MAG: MBL fold metallo-hydrolase [Natronohydrobacter sp.]|nr:MBL fold metallo-hydrolase [Natronohydrobacter sp.]
MLSLQGCATPEHPRADDAPTLAPPALLSLGLAAVATGAALQLWCDDGAPQTVAPDDLINQDGTVTWLGHSGFVVQMAGQTIITDPVVHETALTRASLGGRMARAPDISNLKTLDAVVLSHDDLDHLDRATLRVLAARFPQATLILPEGTRLSRPVTGFARQIRLSEWQAHQIGSLTITATPAIHLSRRPPFLSAPGPALSFSLASGGQSVFFSGDSSYGPVFADIGTRLGPFDLALVPIGAWKPEAFLNDMHMTPEQAAQLARDLAAPRAVPHHYGTFRMTPDTPAESLARLQAAAGNQVEVIPLPVGGTTCITP